MQSGESVVDRCGTAGSANHTVNTQRRKRQRSRRGGKLRRYRPHDEKLMIMICEDPVMRGTTQPLKTVQFSSSGGALTIWRRLAGLKDTFFTKSGNESMY